MKWHLLFRKTTFLIPLFSALLITAWPIVLKGEWEEGQARFGLDYRSIRQADTIYLGNYHFDLRQDVLNLGLLSFWLDWAEGRTPEKLNTLGKGLVSLKDFRLTKATLNGVIGDSSLRLTSFNEKFANSLYPDIYFRGIQGELYSVNEKIRLKVFGGDLTHPEGFLGFTFIRRPERLYGIHGIFQISKNAFLGSALTMSRHKGNGDQDNEQSKNQVVLVDGQWNMLPWLKWLGEYKTNRSRDQAGKETTDRQFKAGPIIENKKLRMEFNYRYSGANFYILQETPQPEVNQKGYFWQAQANPLKGVSLFANLDFSRNGLNGKEQSKTDDLRKNAGFFVTIPKTASLSFFYNSSGSRSLTASPTPVDLDTSSLYSELRFDNRLGPYLRYRNWRVGNPLSPQNSFRQMVYTIGLRPVLKKKWQTYLEAEMSLKANDNGEEYKQYLARTGFYYFRSARFCLWGEVNFTQDRQNTDLNKKNHFAGYLGATGHTFWGFQYHIDIRYDKISNTQAYMLTPHPDQLQFTLRLSKALRWGKSKAIAGLRPGAQVRGFGAIEGTIFNDLNQNGIQEKGESGIAGIILRLEDGSRIQTDKNGRYRFSPVAMGTHLIRLEIKNIPIQYNILSPDKMKIEVKLREAAQANFIFVESGRIKGAVILDGNNNGKADPGEKGVADVFIYLDKNDINTYTGGDGGFFLENINPGRYAVKIDPSTLPRDMELVSAEVYPVTVEAGKEVTNVVFLVTIKTRPVIIRKSPENKILKLGKPFPSSRRSKKPQNKS